MSSIARGAQPVGAAADPDWWPPRRMAWWGLVMLTLAYAVAIIDRIGIGMLVQPIEKSLQISDTQMGLLQGAAFALFYSFLGVPLGMFADRTNRCRLISAGIAVWSIGTIACGLSHDLPTLFAGRLLVGAGEACLVPAATSLIGDYFRPELRARAFGIFTLGTAIGAGFAFLMTGTVLDIAAEMASHGPPFLARTEPWKIVFFLFGAPGLVVALVFALTVKEPPRREGFVKRTGFSLGPLKDCLARHKQVYGAFLVGGVASAVSLYILFAWFPTFLIRVHGWTPGFAARTIGLYGVPCGALSGIASGWIVAAVGRRRADAPVLVATGAFVCIGTGGLIIGLSNSAVMAMVGYMLMSLTLNTPIISMLTALNRITPNSFRAQIFSVLALANGLISQTAGPFLVGLLNDHVFGREKGLGLSIMSVVVFVSCVAIVALLLVRARYKRTSEAAA